MFSFVTTRLSRVSRIDDLKNKVTERIKRVIKRIKRNFLYINQATVETKLIIIHVESIDPILIPKGFVSRKLHYIYHKITE